MSAPLEEAYALFENGEVMNREVFHRRYEQCEDLQRVELIEGVVYLPWRIGIGRHSRPQGLVIQWIGAYEGLHEGDVECVGPATVFLADQNEPEPDPMMYRVGPGRFFDDEGDFLLGAPELIVEIASTSRSRDLHQKKRAYERNGVLEYIVWRVRDKAIDWFQLQAGAYVMRTPDENGIIESEVFPGLRLDVPAMLAMERTRVLAALERT